MWHEDTTGEQKGLLQTALCNFKLILKVAVEALS